MGNWILTITIPILIISGAGLMSSMFEKNNDIKAEPLSQIGKILQLLVH